MIDLFVDKLYKIQHILNTLSNHFNLYFITDYIKHYYIKNIEKIKNGINVLFNNYYSLIHNYLNINFNIKNCQKSNLYKQFQNFRFKNLSHIIQKNDHH